MRSKSLDIRDAKIYADYQKKIADGLQMWEIEIDLATKYKLSVSRVQKIVKKMKEKEQL